MQVLICFDYLSCDGRGKSRIVKETENSKYLKDIYDDIATLNDFIADNPSYDDIINDEKAIFELEDSIKSIITDYVNANNNDKLVPSTYLWIDEMVPVIIKGRKSRYLSRNDDDDYYDKKALKYSMQKYIDYLCEKGNYDPKTFNDVVYYIMIDVIPRNYPMCCIYHSSDHGYYDDEY